MYKQGRWFVLMIVLLAILPGCVGGLWTGANLVYDRHNVYKKLDDYTLYVKVNNALSIDRLFKNNQCILDLAVFNGDILVAGHVPSLEMKEKLSQRLDTVTGYRRLFNQVRVMAIPSNSVQDSWVTAKIRSRIFADGSIDPNAFKVITSDKIVYLMGDVRREQAEKVVTIARQTSPVVRVVKILKYFKYQHDSSLKAQKNQ